MQPSAEACASLHEAGGARFVDRVLSGALASTREERRSAQGDDCGRSEAEGRGATGMPCRHAAGRGYDPASARRAAEEAIIAASCSGK
eukprot:COSAG06_NODE_22968_length_707_cov_0.534539_1_plen_88_part_00